jgi:phage FluMu gp28-like protein
VRLIKGVPRVPDINTQSAAAKAAAKESGVTRRHGDFAISLFLAEYAFHREAGELGWTAAPSGSGRWVDDDDPGDEDLEIKVKVGW